MLGLDYHTHQKQKQKAALLRLHHEREITEEQADVATGEEGSPGTGGGGTCAGSPCLPQREALDSVVIKEEASVGHVNINRVEKIGIASVNGCDGGDICVHRCDTHQTGLHAMEALEGHTEVDRVEEQKLDITHSEKFIKV